MRDHDRFNKPANGIGITGRYRRQEPLGKNAAIKKDGGDVSAVLVQKFSWEHLASERTSEPPHWSSGRSGEVNFVAAHKWFNLAALKRRADAIAQRREIAEIMPLEEIATAQREARAWISPN